MNEEKTKTRGFHITVTSLKKGEIVVDTDTNCIIAGMTNEKGNSTLVMTECNLIDLMSGLIAAEKAVKEVNDKLPTDFFKAILSRSDDE